MQRHFQQANLERARRKHLFVRKYECFVDRIYGKMERERRALEGVMHVMRE